MLTNLSFDPQKTTDKIIHFIRTTLKKTGFAHLAVGLSGGLDSAVCLSLAIRATGAENIYVGLFPYEQLNPEGLNDAKLLVGKFNLPVKNIILLDIKPLVDPIVLSDPTVDDLRIGNIMARARMILLYDLAKKHQALVLGTENKSEYLLGYFTRFGDEASDLAPLRHLYKTQVKKLAYYLCVPQKIIKKIPTAGLLKAQTDEKDFGFTYEEADRILSLYLDNQKNPKEIIKKGFKKATVDRVIDRLKANEFKRATPYIIG